MSSQVGKRHRTGCHWLPVQTLCYSWLHLHKGSALVVWPGMLFQNSPGYWSYCKTSLSEPEIWRPPARPLRGLRIVLLCGHNTNHSESSAAGQDSDFGLLMPWLGWTLRKTARKKPMVPSAHSVLTQRSAPANKFLPRLHKEAIWNISKHSIIIGVIIQ